jgi:hypothetical protein
MSAVGIERKSRGGVAKSVFDPMYGPAVRSKKILTSWW